MGDYLLGILDALKSIPKFIIESFFVSDESGNKSIAMALFQKEVKFGMKYYLAYQKNMFLLRAIGQLFVIYLLATFLLNIAPRSNEVILIVCVAFIIVLSGYLSGFLIFSFHPGAFKEILFENDYQTEQKEYRMLGLCVKLLCIIQICTVIIKGLVVFVERGLGRPLQIEFEWPMITAFGAFILIYGILSLFNRGHGIHVFRKDIPNKMEIVMASETLFVDPNHQFIVENSSGNLYIAPMNVRVNPDFASYPKPCQIPIADIFYIQLGAKRIEYDNAKKNWKYKE